MGWSDKAKAGSNTVEGVITDYTFMDTFPFGDGDDSKKSKKGKKDDGDNIYMLLEITPDGADEPNKRSLYLGSGQFLRIEEDGKTLVSTDDDGVPRLYDQGEVFKFIESLEKEGFPAESRFPDISENKVIDLRGMLNWRIRLVNEIDEEATKKLGKRKVTEGKHKGKEFNRTWTKVTKVLGEVEGNGKKSKATGSKKTTKPADDDDDNGGDEEASVSKKDAVKFLKAVLKAQKNEQIEKSGLPLAITRQAGKEPTKLDGDTREAMRKYLTDEDNLSALAEDGVIEFDASSKKQIVKLAE